MPSRVLLISANRCTTPDPVFPLGLACLNAALRQAGHETAWLDGLASPQGLVETLRAWRPDFVGISLRNIDDVLIRQRETFFEEVGSLSEGIRRHGRVPIILGGSGFSIFPRELLDLTGADFGIAGEGEGGLLSLVDALNHGSDYSGIPGLVYRRDGRVVLNPPAAGSEHRQLTSDDRPAAIVAHYLRAGGMLNLQTQRGCRFRCCYCTYPLIEGALHRRRPPEMVAEEFELLARQGARYVFVVDSIFNSSPRHVAETCEALLRGKAGLPWGCFLRPQGLTRDLMELMARAGLTHIEFGSDSFSDGVLRAYLKDFTFEDIFQSSELARQRKVEHCHFLICGGPGETLATLAESYENSKRLAGGVFLAVVGMRIYPGTDLFEQALAEGRLGTDASLLAPAYYLAPGLTEAAVFDRLGEFARLSPSWIVGDPAPGYKQLIQRLRQRGVCGPLWSYFSAAQRLWQPAAASPA
jgi:radical SAM superfamily enzyme YgiQ (UPF0313 family)